jgi:hypothetical protein
VGYVKEEDAVERNSWGKSRCEQMCHFPITGGLHHTSGDAPLETPTLRDPELITGGMGGGSGMRGGSVVEDAFEHHSWGKFRCEQMCRFPNTGGLHRTSGGAPLETPTLQFQFQCGIMYISQILCHPNKPRLQQSPTNRYVIIQ